MTGSPGAQTSLDLAGVSLPAIIAGITLLCLFTIMRHRRPKTAFSLPLFTPQPLQLESEDDLLDLEELATSIGAHAPPEFLPGQVPTAMQMQQSIEKHLRSPGTRVPEATATCSEREVVEPVDASDELRAAINDLRRARG